MGNDDSGKWACMGGALIPHIIIMENACMLVVREL